jgi:hypothetical protein
VREWEWGSGRGPHLMTDAPARNTPEA